EAGVVRPAVEEHHHVVAVVELDGPVHEAHHLLRPLALLGTPGVGHRGLAALDRDDPEELVVVGDAVGAAEPAHRTTAQLLAPALGHRPELVVAGTPAL